MCTFLFQAHPPPRVSRVGCSPQAGHYRRGRGESETWDITGTWQCHDHITVCQQIRQPQTLAQIPSPVNVYMEIQFGNYLSQKPCKNETLKLWQRRQGSVFSAQQFSPHNLRLIWFQWNLDWSLWESLKLQSRTEQPGEPSVSLFSNWDSRLVPWVTCLSV